MTLPVTITGISTAVAPVGPFKTSLATSVALYTITTALSSSNTLGGAAASARLAQTFTTGSDTTAITSVTFALSKQNNPLDNLVVDIYAVDGSSLPTGSSLGTSIVRAGSTLTTSATRYAFAFTTAVAVSPNTKYAAAISRSGANDGTNTYFLHLDLADTDAAQTNARYSSTTTLWTAGAVATRDYDLLVSGTTTTSGSTDAYYFFGRDGTTATTLQAFKSTAPDTSWASVTSRTGFTTAILNIAGYQVGNVIHLLVQDGTLATSVATKYLSFDAATDTFLTTTETVVAASNIAGQATSGWGCSLVYRPTAGEVVAFYNTTATNTSGTPRSRLSYRRRTGVNTYQTAVQVDPNTATESTQPIAVLGASDRVHLLFFNGTNTMQRHLTSANVLGTAASTGATTAVQDACAYDDAGTIRHVGFTAAQSIRWASADNPTVTAATVTFGTPVRTADDGTDVYALYQNSGDSDLYTKKSTDNGATFGSAVSAFVGTVTAAAASVSKNQLIYQRGNFVFPYLVNDGGSTWKYNETTVRSVSTNKTLDATVGASYAVTGSATTTVLLKRKIDATTGSSYALVGTDVAVTKGVPPKVLTADGGSYLLTGAATTTILRRARIDATAASYAVTGASTNNVLLKRKLDAATTPGAYALTGTAASLLHKYRPAALGGSYLLTGTDAAVTKTTPLVNKTLPAGTASYALTGTDAAVIKRVFRRLTADGSSYAVTGNATAVLLHRWKIAADAGAYAVTGTAAVITRFANKRLTADSSSYAITGAATTSVLHKWKMVATTPASYALTGNSATFLIHKDIVSAAPGAYALTGFAVNFQIRTDKFLSAALGTYILTPTAVSLRKTWKHVAAAGSYAVTGTDAAITRRVPKTVVAASGSYALSGSAASVLHRWKHAAAGGSYAVTGSAARPWYGYRVSAGTSSYLVTGTAATVRKTAARTVTALGSSYALTGTAALARRGLKLFAPIGGGYALTGDPARPWHGYKVAIGAASYSLTGTAATLSRLRKVVTAEAGAYALTGKPALVLYRWTLPAAASSYAVTGTPAILRRVRTVTAVPGAYALVGSPVIINRVGLWYVVAEPATYEITGNVARLFTGEWTISSRTVVVAAEDRTAEAIGESRTVQAIAENRLVTVAADIRTVQAIAENRTIQSAGESHGVSQVEQQRSRRSPRLQHRLVATADLA